MNMTNVTELEVPRIAAPAGYTSVSYIYPVRSAIINTGVILDKNKHKIEVSMKTFGAFSRGCFFGVTTRDYMSLSTDYTYPDLDTFYFTCATDKLDIIAQPNTFYHIIYDLKNSQVTINSEVRTINSRYSNDQPLYIFGNSSLYNYREGCYIYSFKIYENDVLIRDYTPLVRNSDSVAGLYDTLNKVFYENVDEYYEPGYPSYFDVGPTTISVAKIENSNGDIIWGSQSAFPYRRLEYIHLNGAEYINTGLKASYPKNRAIWIKADSNNPKSARVIGAYNSASADNARRCYFLVNRDSGFGFSLGNQWVGGKVTSHLTDEVLMYSTINSTGKTATWGVKSFDDQTTYDSGSITTDGAVGQTANIFIGTNSSDAGSPDTTVMFKGNVYKYTIKTTNGSGPIETAMYPCQRKSDGVCGLYDIISGSFKPMIGTTITDNAAGPIVDEYWDLTAPS